MRFATDKLLFMLLLMLVTGLASAQENRLALVIGNSEYKDSPLINPINDANDMASVLEDLGFEVILRTDSDRREMGRAIRDFGRKLKENRGVGLFYYAGHGMQIDNRNYLIPVGTPLEEEDEVPYEAVDVGSVLAKMESAGNALNLIILDACRNNPFPGRFRSASRGLARVEAPIGSLVVYSTAPGAVADDGEGRNGVFTGALLQELRSDGQSLTQTIRRTRAAVVEATNGRQVPWESSSLLQDYYFSPEPQSQVALRPASEPAKPEPLPHGDSDGDATAAVESRTERLTQSLVSTNNTSEQDSVSASEPTSLVEPEVMNETSSDNTSDQIILADASAQSVAIELATNEAEDASAAQVPSPPPPSAATTEAPDNTLALLDNGQEISPQAPAAQAPQDDAGRDEIIEPNKPPTNTRPVQSGGTSTLTVNVEPADARIRIMDIVEKYKPGMVLDNNRTYNIYVTHKGYDSFREDISLEELSTSFDITLKRQSITEPEMASISGGTFSMGCSRNDKQCEAYEKPAHSVNVSPYAIAVTEVTVGQFDEFVTGTGYVTDAERDTGGNAGCFVWSDIGGISRSAARWGWKDDRHWRNPGYQQSANHPVTCISWNDASNYANWLAAETGRNYALPSEAQWEMAARAGSSGSWGSASSSGGICAYANVADKSQSSTGSKWNNRVNCTDYHWFSAPVSSYKANEFGLFDMQGNAWEWVADTWADSFEGAPGNGAAYNPGNGNERVLRGGGWDSDAKRARLSSRSKASATGRAAMTGFRLVLNQTTR